MTRKSPTLKHAVAESDNAEVVTEKVSPAKATKGKTAKAPAAGVDVRQLKKDITAKKREVVQATREADAAAKALSVEHVKAVNTNKQVALVAFKEMEKARLNHDKVSVKAEAAVEKLEAAYNKKVDRAEAASNRVAAKLDKELAALEAKLPVVE